jgi:osmotically-inducible protein OsmY
MVRTDLGVHAAVRTALRGVLGPAASRVSVVVRDGVVTLTGVVDTPQAKLAAERVTQQVSGVHAVAEELEVRGEQDLTLTDQAVAAAVLEALSAGAHPIGVGLTIKVEHGWVVIGGAVASSAESAAVERALECVPGVRGVTSEVRIEPRDQPLAANRVSPVESIVPPSNGPQANRPRRA